MGNGDIAGGSTTGVTKRREEGGVKKKTVKTVVGPRQGLNKVKKK